MSSFRDDDRFDAELVSFLDDEAARVDIVPGLPSAQVVTTRVARRLEAPSPARWPVALAGALTLTVLATAWLVASFRTFDTRPSALVEVVARGSVRIAVRPDFPQSVAGGLGGFDLDIANELARRLGLRSELMIRSTDEMLRPDDPAPVDLALPSDGRMGADQGLVDVSTPYYHWPVFVVVADTSPATALSALEGGTICAAVDSAGADWLEGSYAGPSSTPIEAPPGAITTRSEASDRDCLDALLSGEIDAIVTNTLSPADLAARPVRTLGGAVLTDPRSILAQRAGADPTDLIAEVDRVLSEMRTDGTLVGFSQNRFGGRDLTVPATP